MIIITIDTNSTFKYRSKCFVFHIEKKLKSLEQYIKNNKIAYLKESAIVGWNKFPGELKKHICNSNPHGMMRKTINRLDNIII